MTQLDRQEDQQNNTGSGAQAATGEPDKAVSSLASGSGEVSNQSFGLKFTLESGEIKLFTSLPISLGRAESNDIILPEETVSAHHARIYYDEKVNDICIVDLDSLNGLFINHQPTRRNVLYDGVKIGLGNATLVFRDTGFIYPG